MLSFQSLALQPAQQENLNRYFASELSKAYEKSFLESLDTYNDSKHTVGSVLKNHKDLDRKFRSKAALYKNEKLPTFSMSDDSLKASVGPNIIHFSLKSLIEGEVFVNETKLNLLDLEQELSTKNLNIKTSDTNLWENTISFLINKAYANDSDKFEILIFSTLIALKDDFDSTWCMFDSCREVRAKRNFEMAMHEVKLQAIQCDNRDSHFTLPNDLEDYPNTQMNLILKDKLVDLFHSFPDGSLTCQKMVETFREEEVKNVTSRIERRGYGGVDSYTAEQNKEANRKDFNRYIQEVCQPFVDLRNCLIDRHTETHTIHDKARGHGKHGAWKSYRDQYEAQPRGQGVQR